MPAVRPHDLATEDLLLLEDGHCLRDHALAACALEGARRNIAFQGTSLQTLVMMAANGLGVTLVPEMAIAAGVLRGLDLHAMPLEGDNPARRIALVWRRSAGRKETFRLIAAVLRQGLAAPAKIAGAMQRRQGPRFVLTALTNRKYLCRRGAARRLSMALRYFDMDALESTPLTKEPFQHFVVPGFVRPEACAEINRDYPRIAETRQLPRRPADLWARLPRIPRRTGERGIPPGLRGEVRPRPRRPAAYDHGSRPV